MSVEDSWSKELHKAFDRFEQHLRILFLCELTMDNGDLAKKYAFSTLKDQEERYAWEYGHKKMMALAHTWKYRISVKFEVSSVLTPNRL